MKPNTGLNKIDTDHLLSALIRFPEIEEAIIFGSRAKGNYKKGSDVDIAIKGSYIEYQTVLGLKSMLEENLPLPYFFDVIHYESINSPELKEHIDRAGKTIYSKPAST
ncbi:MAG: nucleotidyltransferase domain-containing protein [Candidatus Margulisiibacteriota bacterium]